MMSIQHNPNYGAAHLPPSPSDALYWREQHYLESKKRAHLRPRPNPELNENVRRYWNDFFQQVSNDNNSQSG